MGAGHGEVRHLLRQWFVRLANLVFALFPLFWLLPISLTPDQILYREGITLWPSEITFANLA